MPHLRLTSEKVSVSLFEVSEGAMEMFWEVHLERMSKLENDQKVARFKGCEGALFKIQNYVKEGYYEVGRGRGIKFEECVV